MAAHQPRDRAIEHLHAAVTAAEVHTFGVAEGVADFVRQHNERIASTPGSETQSTTTTEVAQ